MYQLQEVITKLPDEPLDPFGLSIAIKKKLQQEVQRRKGRMSTTPVKRPLAVKKRLLRKMVGATPSQRIAYMKAITRGGFE